jgi:hypothetical protein
MGYSRVEDIILEQLNVANYALHHSFEWCFAELELVIPKNKGRPKIVIEFAAYFWDKETESFLPWGEAEHSNVLLKTFWESQSITLYNEELKTYLKDVVANYWALESEKRRNKIAADDRTWAARFKEAFK